MWPVVADDTVRSMAVPRGKPPRETSIAAQKNRWPLDGVSQEAAP